MDVAGSRPAARQSDGMVGAARIRYPRELRAIPNNAFATIITHEVGAFG